MPLEAPSTDLEEIFNLDPAVLEQLQEEEPPPKNHVDVDEASQNLPPEYVATKMSEKKEMGWNEVHNDIEEAPFCEKRLRITKVCFCRNCT